MCFDYAFVSSFLYLSGVSSLSEQQVYGSEYDAFSGSCFSCYHREPRKEFHIERVYECEILDI